MYKKRLLWQLYFAFLLVIVISVAGVAWYASDAFYSFYLELVADDLKSKAYLIEDQILTNLANQNFKAIDDFCKLTATGSETRITVILPDGKVAADSYEMPDKMSNHSDRQEFQEALKYGLGKSTRLSPTLGKQLMYLAIPLKQNDKILGVVRTAVPVNAIETTLTNIHKNFIWAGVIIAVCSAVISLLLSRRISRPIEQMTEVAKNVASGNFDMRLPVPDTAEFAYLAKASNEMAYQLNSKIEAITEERSQMQAILSSMVEGVLAVDEGGRIVSINKAAANLLGINASISTGRTIEEVIRNPQLQQFVQNTIDNKLPAETDSIVLEQDDRFLQLYGSNLTDNKGSRNGAVMVLHDITRTRRLEEVRRDFVANVSHELKTPITSIKGFVETLSEGAIDNPQQARRFLEIVAKHADRLNAIVDDLLSLSLLEEDTEKRRLFFENAALKPALAAAVELAKTKAEKKNITIELTCDESLSAKMNTALIEQAVFNLIDNAVKYSPDDSKIHIDAKRAASEILINVADQGCGIPKEHLERIFERFYVVNKSRSRKLGGTGLGLAIVKHIAQVHGGYVDVRSSVNAGSTFTIHLPGGDFDPGQND